MPGTSDANPLKATCCSPIARAPAKPSAPLSIEGTHRLAPNAIRVPGGTAFIGTNWAEIPDDGEAPFRKRKIKPFHIGATTVSNGQFAEFVQATGYVTEAENFGWSFVFWSDVPEEIGPTQAAEQVQWWRKVDGAQWDRVDGTNPAPQDHPAVHLSWNDARAYASWAGGRLPTEAEWEHAARGGLGDVRFPWGDQEPNDNAFQPCNIWQGRFPDTNTGKDGYLATAPAKSFAPNGYGLFNVAGNVWEWTADTYRVKSLKKSVKERVAHMRGFKLLKGGSFLCYRSYCYRYRIAARSGNSPDSTTSHQGFRVVWDIVPKNQNRQKGKIS